ncbi:MAG: UDP-3-O-(3-hydroxymyristoyl)glucosamine N-acyltransferase, partial [Myxococcales bacterium]|nr:UDP-3-O-(3-hydroxymyristoyl)glucosamine N-acyltransferase [Myxococcales bacterium]
AQIGASAYLAPYCVVRRGCIVGPHCQLEPHCVIGVRGFGYATDGQGQHHAVPQVGIAVLEEGVEMGSHIAVDRGAVTETRLGRGTKMGNQSAIGHNAVTGASCLMVGHNALAGSSSIGDHVILAGKAGVAGHIHVGDQTTVMAYSAVTRPIGPKQVIRGIPARDAREVAVEQKALRQLPALLERLQALEAKLGEGSS